ncbi:MAG: hypothetical protein FWG82_01425 [Oscillospiraceae bacterium]|nr:hypothetical protein [Oscillospiraceae bacterium]
MKKLQKFTSILLVSVMAFVTLLALPLGALAAPPNVSTPILLDTETPVDIPLNGEIFFSFTPDESGFYSFRSLDNAGDPVGFVLDAQGNQIAWDDDSNGLNFNVLLNLTQGEVYYLGLQGYGGERLVCSVIIKLVDWSLDNPIPLVLGDNALSGQSGWTAFSFTPEKNGECSVFKFMDDYDVSTHMIVLDADGNVINSGYWVELDGGQSYIILVELDGDEDLLYLGYWSFDCDDDWWIGGNSIFGKIVNVFLNLWRFISSIFSVFGI